MVRDTAPIADDLTVSGTTPDPETTVEALIRSYNRMPLNTSLTDGQLLRWNATSGVLEGVDSATFRADDTPIWIPPGGISAVGVGTATASSTLRWPLWTMAIDTIIATTLPAFPAGWTTFDIDVWWTNLTANSGNVNLTMRSDKKAGDGELLVQPNAGTAVIGAAPAQNVVKVTTVISGQATVASKLTNLNLLRSNTSDTLTGNIGVLGINLRKAS